MSHIVPEAPQQDKRTRERYLCDDRFRRLEITHPDSGELLSVTPVNFNCYGVAFFASQPLPESGVTKVCLTFESEAGTLRLDNLLAEMIYSLGSDVGCYCGAAFVSAQVETGDTLSELLEIERALADAQKQEDRYGLDDGES